MERQNKQPPIVLVRDGFSVELISDQVRTILFKDYNTHGIPLRRLSAEFKGNSFETFVEGWIGEAIEKQFPTFSLVEHPLIKGFKRGLVYVVQPDEEVLKYALVDDNYEKFVITLDETLKKYLDKFREIAVVDTVKGRILHNNEPLPLEVVAVLYWIFSTEK